MDPFKERRQYRIQKLKQQRLQQQGLQKDSTLTSSQHPIEEKSYEPLSIQDKHIIRRMKNRESAIRSRKRKDDLIDILSSRIAQLEKENMELKSKLQRTEASSGIVMLSSEAERKEGNNYGLASYLREHAPMRF